MPCRLALRSRVDFCVHLRIPSNKRPFLPGLGSSSPQILTASKIIPYPASKIFALVADVDSYSQFVPYCQKSRVTHWTAPATQPGVLRLPLQADLHVGWGGFKEVFTSRLTCNPELGLVEARSGRDVQPLSAHADTLQSTPNIPPTTVFDRLISRWIIKPFHGPAQCSNMNEPTEWSRADLCIEFQFTNPLYAAVSSAVSETMASVMTDAFEKHARRKLGT